MAAKKSPDRVSLLETVAPESGALTPTVKAYFVGEEGGDRSNAIVQQEKDNSAFAGSGAISPPYDPNVLAQVFEGSSTLGQCVDAYVVNIDSFGHHFEPVIDLESPESDELIRDALRAERLHDRETGEAAKDDAKLLLPAEPKDAEVTARKKELAIEMRAERVRLENFFENCTSGIPFAGPEGLRGLTRKDIEVLGNGFWEVLRNSMGEVTRLNHLVGRTMRYMPVDETPVDVTVPRRISLLKFTEETVTKRFRNLVQVQDYTNRIVFFKEFDDPRITDSATGKTYPTIEAARADYASNGKNGEEFRPATEVLSFKISSVRSVYGTPRWMGALLAVMGNRQAEEVNFLYFENRSVPPLAIIVSGGRLNAETVPQLEDYIANNIRGKRNSHKIMIIEGETGGGPAQANNGRMKIELRPLTDAQQKDALFNEYDKRNAEKIGQTFRLPRILRGDAQDQSPGTAEASIDFTEVQVFGPIRGSFDWVMNRVLLPELKINLHRFVSNGPVIKDPNGLTTMIKDLVTCNVLTPGEGRELAQDVFHRVFRKIDADWTNQPVGITVSGRNAAGSEGADGAQGFGAGALSQPGAAAAQAAAGVDQSKAAWSATDPRSVADMLVKMHETLIRKEVEEGGKDVETIRIPMDLFASCFTPDPT